MSCVHIWEKLKEQDVSDVLRDFFGFDVQIGAKYFAFLARCKKCKEEGLALECRHDDKPEPLVDVIKCRCGRIACVIDNVVDTPVLVDIKGYRVERVPFSTITSRDNWCMNKGLCGRIPFEFTNNQYYNDRGRRKKYLTWEQLKTVIEGRIKAAGCDGKEEVLAINIALANENSCFSVQIVGDKVIIEGGF